MYDARAMQNAANLILSWGHNGEDLPPVIGPLWIHRFLEQHHEYSVHIQKATDPHRKTASNAESVSEWYRMSDSVMCGGSLVSSQMISGMWTSQAFTIGMVKIQKIITKDVCPAVVSTLEAPATVSLSQLWKPSVLVGRPFLQWPS